MPLLLALLYPLAIQWSRGGWWYAVLPVTLLTVLVDFIANLELSLYFWDSPRITELTFSTRLQRLQYNTGWRGVIANKIIPWLDHLDPTGQHIKRRST